MTSDEGEKTRIVGPLANSRPGIVPVEHSSGQRPSNRISALEKSLRQTRRSSRSQLQTDGQNSQVHDYGLKTRMAVIVMILVIRVFMTAVKMIVFGTHDSMNEQGTGTIELS